MTKHQLDYLLIYNAYKEEPSYMSRFLDQDVFDVHYMLIAQNGDIKLCLASWFEHMAQQKYNLKIIAAFQKTDMIQYLLPYLNNNKTIGIAGNIPYKDYQRLATYTIVDSEKDLQKIFAIKTSDDLRELAIIRDYTTTLLETVEIKSGETELDIYKRIAEQVKKDGYELHFLSIAGNTVLKETTVAEAAETVIHEGDILCIDMGLIKNGYNSDATRCYFIGENNLERAYQNIQRTIEESLVYITPGKNNKIFIQEFMTLCRKNGLDEYILTDLGHGIGTSLHEYPDLYHDEFIFENGMVFTIEPEFRIGEYLLRYEDVYMIKNGTCMLMQKAETCTQEVVVHT